MPAALGAAREPTERPSIVHTSLYLPEPVYEALRKIAFEERLKIHDVVLEGIDGAKAGRQVPAQPPITTSAIGDVASPVRSPYGDQ